MSFTLARLLRPGKGCTELELIKGRPGKEMRAVDECKQGRLLRIRGSASRLDNSFAPYDLCLFQSMRRGGIGGQAK